VNSPSLLFSLSLFHLGYLISIYMVGRQSPRRIQLNGFLCMAVLYAFIGYNFDSLNKYALLGLYGASFFFSNYGPNTTVSIIGSQLPFDKITCMALLTS
jgi:PHS family inorganic phosphate transporter-like MFS transporter